MKFFNTINFTPIKLIAALTFFLFKAEISSGQIATFYSFSQAVETYTAITGATVLSAATNQDAATYSLSSLSFPFNGSIINNAVVSTDGYLAVGVSSFTNTTGPLSSATTAPGLIIALGMNLVSSTVSGASSELSYVNNGTETVFQWQDYARSGQAATERFSFQVRINNTSGVIKLVYGTFTVSTSTGFIPQVGLRGATNTDFNARRLTTSIPDSSPSWDDTVLATANGQNVRFTTTSPAAIPDAGRTFVYSPQSPPVNDVCSGAIVIPSSGPFPYLTAAFSNTSATNFNDPANSCQTASNAGIWFTFTPGFSGSYTISSCQSDAPLSDISDNAMSIYTSTNNCSGPFSQVTCDDDNCTTEANQAITSATLTAGTQYYILVYGYLANRGNVQLSVKLIPANDNCIGAMDLTPTPGYFSNPGTVTLSGSTPSSSSATCVTTPSTKQDVWFKFTSDNDGILDEHINLAITPSAGTDISAVLYGGNCGFLIELACKDDTGDGGVENIIYSEVGFAGDDLEVRDNTTYFLRIIDKGNENTSISISATGSTALPVNILTFDAKATANKSVNLSWNVSDENNVLEYTVQRSNDNKSWSSVGVVSANKKPTYQFEDNDPLKGVNYYRLSIKDLNSSINFSKVRVVNLSEKGNISISPNPVDNILFISGMDDKNVVISIFNELGQIVYKSNANGKTVSTGGINVHALIPGTYTIQVKSESGINSMRFVKQ